jgi:hypothetical protein
MLPVAIGEVEAMIGAWSPVKLADGCLADRAAEDYLKWL